MFVSNGEVFIADMYRHRVRKLLCNGQIVGIAGDGSRGYNGDGQLATSSRLHGPSSVVVSSLNQVYISERNRIRKIDRYGIISTIAGTGADGYNGDNQLAIHAQLYYPRGLFVNEDEEVFFCDWGNHRVRKIDRNGMISTIAGNGTEGYNGDNILAVNAALNFPSSVYVYKNEIYITDTNNQRIRKILQNGIITTIAGTETDSMFSPHVVHVHNDQIYFSDYRNHRVRMILPNGMIKKVAGNGIRGYDGDGKLATESKLQYPTGIFVDDSGIYIHEELRLRKVDSDGIIATVIGPIEHGYTDDASFDFNKYPHIRPKKKQLIKPFPNSYLSEAHNVKQMKLLPCMGEERLLEITGACISIIARNI